MRYLTSLYFKFYFINFNLGIELSKVLGVDL